MSAIESGGGPAQGLRIFSQDGKFSIRMNCISPKKQGISTDLQQDPPLYEAGLIVSTIVDDVANHPRNDKMPPLSNVKLITKGGANRWDALINQGISRFWRVELDGEIIAPLATGEQPTLLSV